MESADRLVSQSHFCRCLLLWPPRNICRYLSLEALTRSAFACKWFDSFIIEVIKKSEVFTYSMHSVEIKSA